MRVSLKRVGSMWHWRIGRIGGSLHFTKRRDRVINLTRGRYEPQPFTVRQVRDWRKALGEF